MKNKELQEQRMKGYFLQATKELLKAEGLKSVSVRTIADRAGYSYTTMYSYFKDVNDLVFLCVHDFYEECRQHVKEYCKNTGRGMSSLKAAIKGYADFFIQYPGIFDLFFIEQLGNSKDKKTIVDIINFSLDNICEDDWNYCASTGLVKAEQVAQMKSQVRYAVLGLLLLYLNRRMPASYTEFVSQFNSQLDAIVDAPCAAPGKQAVNTSVHNSLISIRVGNNL